MGVQAEMALIIFLFTYAMIISEKIHRTIIAMLGGLLMVAFGILDQKEAIQFIDFNTIGLLVGMMIIVSITAQTGVFEYVAVWSAQKVKGDPIKILVVLSLLTALASAFLDNVTTVLLVVPVTFSITSLLQVSPIPFLLSEIFAANIGGTATMIGDPPNLMIGSAAKLSFLSFIDHLAWINLIILMITLFIFVFIYKKQLVTSKELKQQLLAKDAHRELKDHVLLWKCSIVIVFTLTGFSAHQLFHLETATIALIGAFLLLLLSGDHYLAEALAKIEWTTLFFFIGLFVIVGGLVETGLIEALGKKVLSLTGGDIKSTTFLILWMSAFISAFVDNIPFVAAMIPLIQEMGKLGIHHLDPLWWSLSLGSCLGGNGTLIGASANLVVAGLASVKGYPISFVTFFKVGFPLMILSIVISSLYLYVRYFL